MTEVIMPKMGDGMEEGTLNEWLKGDGDSVKTGEVIGSIQTDKATLELEAPATGILTGILLQTGGTVPVGKAIALILKPGETVPAGWGGGEAPKSGAAPSAGPVVAPQGSPTTDAPASAPIVLQQAATTPTRPEAASTEFGVTADQATSANQQGTEQSAQAAKTPDTAGSATTSADRVKASPLARKIATERGIDLSALKGSGPGGRIVEKDVTEARPAPSPVPAPPSVAAPTAMGGGDEIVALPRLRQITAKRTTESKQQVPHFYVTVEVDVERILALRQMFEDEGSGKVSINDFVVKASALALRDMPEVNAVFQGANLLKLGNINVGVAVAIPDGLTVPVVKNADQLSLRAISARVRDLAKRAKDNKLALDEMQGSSFSISNMGMLDVDNFLAIINAPNSAILAIASVRKKVVANDQDEIEVRSRMNITCSFDHRTLDGAVGARFINVVKNYLENPTRLLA